MEYFFIEIRSKSRGSFLIVLRMRRGEVDAV